MKPKTLTTMQFGDVVILNGSNLEIWSPDGFTKRRTVKATSQSATVISIRELFWHEKLLLWMKRPFTRLIFWVKAKYGRYVAKS